ncbi:MAG: hypothetical protein EXS27_03395 [Pedosphaera sp.]|nr:hypothetical protein [Pedosphaera sp.]
METESTCAPVGMPETSKRNSARFLVKFCVVPELANGCAPRLLFGAVSMSVVSAMGRSVTESARVES